MKNCSVSGCPNLAHKHQTLCLAHRSRKYRTGDVQAHVPLGARNHGLSSHPLYNTWLTMRNRCLNPNAKDFQHYGGRGIGIDPEWNKFKNFLRDMGEKPNAKLTLERIDVNKNYGPKNCKWATWVEQRHNRRDSHV